MSAEPVVGIVLAAGAGRRLGRGPKAHVVLDGESLLARAVDCCRRGGVAEVWVVGRADDAALVAACRALGVPVVLNDHPEDGMFSSVRCALESLGAAPRTGLLLFPVDHPHVRSSTVGRLVQALGEGGPESWVRPAFEGRRGHPVAVGAALLPRLLKSPGTLPLHEALEAAGAAPVDVAVDDPGVVVNVNQPGDLA